MNRLSMEYTIDRVKLGDEEALAYIQTERCEGRKLWKNI